MSNKDTRRQYARMSAKFRYELRQLEIKINEGNKHYEKNIARANRTIERFKNKYPALSTPLGKYLTEEDMARAMAEMREARAEGALSKISRKRSEANLQDYLHQHDIPLTDKQMDRLYDFLEYLRTNKVAQQLSLGSDLIMELGYNAVRGNFSKEMIIRNVEDWLKTGTNEPRLRRKFGKSSNTDF